MHPCDVPPEAQTLLFAARKLLLVAHLAASIVLVGATTHHAWQMRALLRGTGRPRLERVWARTVAVAFVAVYALGAVLYPTYRYHVRALFLDRYFPSMSNLFDIKENLATIALPLALALGALGGRLTHDDTDKPFRPVYASMSWFVAAVVWFNVVSGVLIVSHRSV